MAERTLSDVLAGKPSTFSWQELAQGAPSPAMRLHHFIEVEPILDFEALQPGAKATDAIRRAAADLKLSEQFGATVALTGTVPLNDDQFSVIRQSALGDTLSALLGALVILWLALRSWKIVGTVFFSLIVGLAVTAALGVAMVGAFNLISIAFFVLFVGLGVDFGIQFSVRYRSERHEQPDLRKALQGAAGKVGDPLALAAAATAVAFFSFLPTSYRGLFELGLIAGCGMLIAFFCSITFVPAMLAIVKPPGESAPVGFSSLAPLDDFLQRHRIAVIVTTIGVVLAASLDEANAVAKRLAALPEVARTRTLSNFIPDDQDEKITALKLAAHNLGAALHPPQRQPAPSDQDTVDAIRKTASDLSKVAGNATGPGAEAARNVSGLLTRLAESNAAMRSNVEAAVVPSLVYDLDRLRDSLDPHPVSVETLPPDLVRDWLSPDGHARVEALPKGNANDYQIRRKFAVSVLAAEPSATGPAISLYESSRTVTGAFIEAGLLALGAIAVLLLIALRRVTDVLLTLIPLLLAGLVTLEISALTNTAINFANIIALPLLLGVGVAFKIYYIMAWRDGKTGLLQSALTRAVIFSAMTNAVAFGSMWASDYPGISSMGRMMALALLCTMAAAVLFQPVLMGTPRQNRGPEGF